MHLNDSNFKEEIKSDLPVVVDFFAEWCGPCKMLAPVFEELSTEYQDRVKFAKVNIDSASTTAQQYNVMSIPTIIIFKDGRNVDQTVGFIGKDSLKEKIDALI
jgi:thioredoxin 1